MTRPPYGAATAASTHVRGGRSRREALPSRVLRRLSDLQPRSRPRTTPSSTPERLLTRRSLTRNLSAPSQRTRTLRALVALLAAGACLVCATAAGAATYPKAVPKEWSPTKAWMKTALCIHSYEGEWDAATGNGYEGGLQFSRATWISVGGPVVGAHWASVASKREQLYRAWIIWQLGGNSWRLWGPSDGCAAS
jgi:hypothetical protein